MGALVGLAPLSGGLFLGWALGANDAANVFGTAVAARIIPYWRAALLCACFVVLGAALQGAAGIETLSAITTQTVTTAVIVSIASAITVTAMTILKLPVSTSQGVVGAILGIGLATDRTELGPLLKVVLCWIGTPIGSLIIAVIAYKVLAFGFRRAPMSMFTRDKILWSGLLLVGLYGSYALGANNVTNTVGMFSGLLPGVSDRLLAVIGGLAIASGTITFGRRVMLRLGSGIMRLDAFTAFVAVLSMSITVHVFAIVGAPISTTQGIVGATLGIGFLRGAHAIHFNALRHIVVGWVFTPIMALILAAAGYAIFC
ncbi:MAG TPA: inorganic phosphate transporter [Candidatus Hydrogenedentes bacterium]|nr:inorganic phosphate transporter [Candidatus Hydrogenedentota bacterium]